MEGLDLTTKSDEKQDRYGTIVAVSVAVLAVFMGIFKVKDDNIVQAMQQAQADKIDNWGWYQAHKTRVLLSESTLSNLKLAPATVQRDEEVKHWSDVISKQKSETDETKKKAEEAEKSYDTWNYRDDQFDMADASMAISIATLAVTALAKKKYLLILGLVFAAFGLLLGLSGMVGIHIHPDSLAKLLGT